MKNLAALGLVIAIVACASTGTASSSNPDLITAAEIEPLGVATAYDAVHRLRPGFLRSRGQVSIQNPNAGYPVVYINGLRSGGIEQLRSIPSQDVLDIRYISASDATTRYGTGHTGGAIIVRTHHGD